MRGERNLSLPVKPHITLEAKIALNNSCSKISSQKDSLWQPPVAIISSILWPPAFPKYLLDKKETKSEDAVGPHHTLIYQFWVVRRLPGILQDLTSLCEA